MELLSLAYNAHMTGEWFAGLARMEVVQVHCQTSRGLLEWQTKLNLGHTMPHPDSKITIKFLGTMLKLSI
jgi:hypothetical protein